MLQQVEVSSIFFKKGITDKGFLLRDESDFCSYFDIEKESLLNSFRLAIKSDIDVEKWDHLQGLLGFSTHVARLRGESPILTAVNILDIKQENILKMILSEKQVFINLNGGYCEFKESTHTLISEQDYHFDVKQFISFSKKPSLINLENDPIIEKYTKMYFKEKNLDISTIVNLGQFNKDSLTKIFEDFKLKGGYGVYVYTTGNDTMQMIDYIDAIKASGLTDLILHINSGNTDKLQDVINHAKETILNTTIKFVF